MKYLASEVRPGHGGYTCFRLHSFEGSGITSAAGFASASSCTLDERRPDPGHADTVLPDVMLSRCRLRLDTMAMNYVKNRKAWLGWVGATQGLDRGFRGNAPGHPGDVGPSRSGADPDFSRSLPGEPDTALG